eukprot:CAMPEP_0185811608 /NCGR_PEP_ID=MMETSP1322-20130828/8316_1 /TAXON_ID=265543 /ORGANISM="Minutocellus polymorphus, Strain RCC2270" /LENGTH=213 /DNA_ID=CAMNT_0028508075 /DNA_START=223 /DNA_END=864 /DNA_ORIENTATION=+
MNVKEPSTPAHGTRSQTTARATSADGAGGPSPAVGGRGDRTGKCRAAVDKSVVSSGVLAKLKLKNKDQDRKIAANEGNHNNLVGRFNNLEVQVNTNTAGRLRTNSQLRQHGRDHQSLRSDVEELRHFRRAIVVTTKKLAREQAWVARFLIFLTALFCLLLAGHFYVDADVKWCDPIKAHTLMKCCFACLVAAGVVFIILVLGEFKKRKLNKEE